MITVLLMVVEAVVEVELQALEPVVHDEVHHARHGVRAINRRGSAGEVLYTLYEWDRNLVQVRRVVTGRSGIRAARRKTATVDEHQVARWTQAAQLHLRGAGGAVRRVAPLRRRHLRQGVQ